MASNKDRRVMNMVLESQRTTEEITQSKFDEIESKVKPKLRYHRNLPQITSTINPEDLETLNEFRLHIYQTEGKIVNLSVVMRRLIELGRKYKSEL